jgi:branched-chain amino acid transport system ATP-binding protein
VSECSEPTRAAQHGTSGGQNGPGGTAGQQSGPAQAAEGGTEQNGPGGAREPTQPARASESGNGSGALLQVEDLRVSYGDAQALFGLNMAVERGEVVAVLGANGAGKSTLAGAISGLVRPVSGHVRFQGVDVSSLLSHRVAALGLAHIPEGRGIFPSLSVIENLRMRLRRVGGRAAREEAIGRAFSLFPVLGQRRRQRAGTLSGGEQQMLALAPVLAAPPALLVADELSLGLAPLLVDAIFKTLESARAQGVTIILIEQFVHRALAFADRAVILQRGTIGWEGPSSGAGAEVLARYLSETAAAEVEAS